MSLRHASRICIATGSKAVQGVKDQAPKCDVASKVNGRRDVRRFSSALESVKRRAAEEERRRAEESLRTVMYLSCWGPN